MASYPPTDVFAAAGSDAALRRVSPARTRELLATAGGGGVGDKVFGSLVLAAALSVPGIVLLILGVLVVNSHLSLQTFGLRFFVRDAWNPVLGDFGALPFLFGTVVTSLLALVLAVPLSLCAAVFLLEVCPRPLRGPVTFLTDLLAAIPSVVYGLWAVVVLVPFVRDVLGPVLVKTLGWTGFFSGPNFGEGILTAAIVLAIMILPVIASVTREVMRAVPASQREAALALGATRWEMIRMAVLRNARMGIAGAAILGLGRALGETMAVTMVIGNNPQIAKSLFTPGYTLASVLANEFTEATDALYLSALVEIGLALFLLTVLVNVVARLLVWAVTRGHTGMAQA